MENWYLEKDPIDLELKENSGPICLSIYPLLNLHNDIFKDKVKLLVLMGVFKESNDSKWPRLGR